MLLFIDYFWQNKLFLFLQLSEVSHKFEHLAGQSEDTHRVHRLDGKVRDLESKLELEQTTRSRLEVQLLLLYVVKIWQM